MATPNQYVQTNTLYLAGSGVIIGATVAVLETLTDIYGNVLTMSDFGIKGYITFEPDTTNEEAATFTGVVANANGTYSLTGLSTGLAKSPYTETSGLIRAHAGGTKVVVTDNVEFWNTFANKANDETITGQWTFNTFPITPTNSQATDTIAGVQTLKVHNYAVDTGTSNTYVIAPSPAITGYTTGAIFTFKAINANTGVSTVNINSLGAKTIKKNVSTDLAANDILANQLIAVEYDGTNFQLISSPSSLITDTAPNVINFTSQNTKGSVTTQFTITNTSGTTYRYTYTGTGTNPGDFTTYLSVGSTFSIQSTAMSAANTGLFVVTAVQPTYIEVTNGSGVAEATKALTNGYLDIGTVYTSTTGTKYITLEIVGAGASGVPGTGGTVVNFGGGAGGYVRKLMKTGFSGLQCIIGTPTTSSTRTPSGLSAFGSTMIANGAIGAVGGTASGGDLNIQGNSSTGNIAATGGGNAGASSIFGGNGAGAISAGLGGSNATGYGSGGGGGGTTNGSPAGVGFQGIIIITEHFI